jgi:hypothetical protein
MPDTDDAEIHDSKNGIYSDWTRRYTLALRQHEDGRMILYGRFFTRWQGENDARAGVLLAPGADVAIAAQQVADDLGCSDPMLVRELLAEMPPITLE